MFLIVKNSDNLVINDRQSSHPVEYAKAEDLRTQLANEKIESVRQTIQDALTLVESKINAYESRRKQAIIRQYGGIEGDYSLHAIPEAEKAEVMSALYIEYDGTNFIYQTGGRYVFSGSQIIIYPQWVRGNYKLESADVTDFSGETLTEDLNFRLAFFQDNVSKQISVELFIWGADEDCADMVLVGKTFCSVICEGVVVASDNSITLH